VKNPFRTQGSEFGGRWRAVRIACKPGFEDIVSACIFESGFSGFIEEGEPGLPFFTAYYEEGFHGAPPPQRLVELLIACSGGRADPAGLILSDDEVPPEDWETSWRAGIGAVEAGPYLLIRPSWVPAPGPGSGRTEIIIDPKMAFGSGSHATTFLCLEALQRMNLNGLTMLDAGCGSGILSIAAAKLGACRVLGIDIDPFSVDNARENVTVNGVSEVVEIRLCGIAELSEEPFDLICANILSSVIISSLPYLHRLIKPGGRSVFSGILAEEEETFTRALRSEGYQKLAVTSQDGWVAVEAES